MKPIERYLKTQVINDLDSKMVFIGGPRQVGKTTLAKSFLPDGKTGYLNWDIPEQREAIYKRELPNNELWVFDEIHKYGEWRNYLKGIYDEFHDTHKVLVTGSAKLDAYRRGGDSLQGRYHYLHMHPLSVAELKLSTPEELKRLLLLGGFPEPYFSDSETTAKRWSREYRMRLLEEELTSLENVQDLSKLELLMMRLPDLVASPLSINSLREDLSVSHKSVSRWISIFENLYAIFRIPPFTSNKLRAVQKEQKHYHFDWSLIEKEGPKFENLVASHLLKWVHFEQDTKARDVELCYFRDVDGREVDFIVTEKGKPIWAIECKSNDSEISKALKYFKKRFSDCEAIQIAAFGEKNYISPDKITVMPAISFLTNLI